MNGQETEAKFYVSDKKKIEARLRGLGARLTQARVLEQNLRFDRPDAGLRAEGRVLRLRRDTQARLTYKGPSSKEQGVLSRREIEFTVESFEAAREFLEALGYRKLAYYEKYRTMYEMEDTHVMLDELPYGSFVEIEGVTVEAIRAAAEKLGLNWGAAIPTSYLALLERVRRNMKVEVEDLSFEDFKGINALPAHLEVRVADE